MLDKVDEFMKLAFGIGAYFVPILLTYLAVAIFRAEENQISPAVKIATAVEIILISGIFGLFCG